MTDRDFLDSNVLVYAYNRGEPGKQVQAQELLERGYTRRDRSFVGARPG